MKLMQIAFEEEAEPVDDAVDSTEESSDEPETVDFELALADPDYNLDDLRALEEKREVKQKRKERENDSTQHLLTTACELAKALEQLAIYGQEALPKVRGNVFVSSAVSRHHPRMALESFNLGATSRAVLATLKDLFKRILEAIKRAVKWVGEQLRNKTNLDTLTINSVKQATDAFLMVRKDDLAQLNRAYKLQLSDENQYVDIGAYKLWLIINGEQPEPGREDYAYAMARVLKVIQIQRLFDVNMSQNLIEALKVMTEDIAEGRPIADISKVFDPLSATPEGATQTQNYHGYVPEADRILFAYDDLLGSVAFCNEYPRHPEPTPEYTALNRLAGWLTVFKKGDETMNNGTMRLLHTDEVKNTSKIVEAIGDVLVKHRTALQTLQQMSESITSVVGALEKKISAQADPSPVMIYEYCKVAQACNALVRNGSTVLESTSLYARKVMYAWGLYVTATTKKDLDLVRQASAMK